MNQEELLRSALNLRGKTVLVTALDLNTGTFAKAFLRRVIGVDMVHCNDGREMSRLELILDCGIDHSRESELQPRLLSYKSISIVPKNGHEYNGEIMGYLVPDAAGKAGFLPILCTFTIVRDEVSMI